MRAKVAAGALAIAAMMAGPAFGQDVVGQWSVVSPPAAPVLQAVTLDDAHTALLVLDFSEPCASRPRCQATLTAEAKLIAAARQHGVVVIFSEVTGEPAEAIPAVLAPAAGEEIVRSGPDKFVSTDLSDLLRNGGISTVIVTGTAAEGAVLDTGLDAGLREGVRVVVPVDLISSSTLYGEQAVAWDFANAPGISARAVLTRSAMIGF